MGCVKLTPIIQLGFDPQDDRLWWCDQFKWDTTDETPDTIQRPTEQAAFRRMFRQARLISKRGILVNLSPLHLQVMRMEQSALISEPVPDNVHTWIAARMHGIPPLQIKAILDECSFVVLLREVLGLPALVMDWELSPAVKKVA